MSKHTPGPWKVSRQNGDGLPGLEGLAGVVGPEQTSSRGHKFTLYVAQYVKPEDADLIAAAPELLEACAAAIEQIEALDTVLNQSAHEVIGWHLNGEAEPIASFFEDNDIGAIAKLRAAIAKAKGESE